MPKEYDSWARTPVPEAGPLLSAEMERRGGSLLVWRFAFFALGDPQHSCMTLWAWAPVSEAGSPWCASGEIFCGVSGRERESLP
jgi:hypothetical protein